ncbi:TPA: hypothetical protein M5M69_004399 [Citrobacter freundii]|uniref:hypothetical protein n=1 Tax=Citrobacter freundii TaxID=546 RepID=UPI00177C0EC6|nr:hypothetical protein [Citrobacter freundii]MBD5698796.1 hypothetical protein [Citrobacter freundii]HBB9912604.1 hypothetical protein [Citrobacter freundii]HBC1998805.1 hypothetical protein [Citrobacter freundii]HBM8410785.1 hypothetical protein [Citrobacter freundii]HBM9448455.1 hypothetical protein [Citrobacter freundii]
MKYEFEKHLNTKSQPSTELQVSALQVGLVSLVQAIEKSTPGFGEVFLQTFDNGFKQNREANNGIGGEYSPVEALALLGTMIKNGL